MKKLLMVSSLVSLLVSYEANAQVSAQITFGDPGYVATVVEPGPAYITQEYNYPSQYYERRHRHNAYWTRGHRGRENYEHRGHEGHDEHGRR